MADAEEVKPEEAHRSSGRRLKQTAHWRSIRLGVTLLLAAAAIATALGAWRGWTNSAAGAAVAFVLAVTAVVFNLVQEELADRTVREGLIIAGIVVCLATVIAGSLWLLRERPSNIFVLNGDLNIAVLPFVSDDDDSDEITRFSDEFTQGTEGAISRSAGSALEGTGLEPAVRVMGDPVNLAQPDAGVTEDATSLATRANADFVVTGQISFRQASTIVQLMVFVSPSRVPDAPELSGWYLGTRPMTATADLRSNLPARGRVYQQLDGAMTTLVRLGLALEELAARQLSSAVDILRPLSNSGDERVVPRELVLLFLGNALGRQACELRDGCDQALLAAASEAYEEAVRIAPEFPRGRVGQAEVMFQHAGCGDADVDVDQLDAAEALFGQVASDPAASDLANSKALLGLVRVKACRAAAGSGIAVDEVASIADVLEQKRDDDPITSHLAAEARSFEAVVAAVQSRNADAVSAYARAIELSTQPHRTALWQQIMAKYLVRPPLCDEAGADEALKTSISLYDELIPDAPGPQRETLEEQRLDSAALLAELGQSDACG
jgi:hypothetical protein